MKITKHLYETIYSKDYYNGTGSGVQSFEFVKCLNLYRSVILVHNSFKQVYKSKEQIEKDYKQYTQDKILICKKCFKHFENIEIDHYGIIGKCEYCNKNKKVYYVENEA